MNSDLLLGPIVIPAVAGLICYLVSRKGRGLAPVVAVIGAICTFVLCIRIFSLNALSYNREWLTVGGFQIAISLASTTLTSFINLAISFFGLAIVLYSVGWMKGRADRARFFALTMWTLASAVGAVFSENLIFFLICWEVTTLMLYLLVNLGPEPARKEAAKSFVMLGLSDCALLLGIALLWGSGTIKSLSMSQMNVQVGSAVTYWAYILMMIGAITKAGAFPVHTWIPAISEDAHTPVMAFIPACLDKLLGIYLLARLSLGMFKLDGAMQLTLLGIGGATVILAVMMAMVQHDMKKLLSYHAVSQVGYMLLGIGTGTWIGAVGGLFHMLNNALYKSTLFLGAGAVESKTGNTDLDKLGGLTRLMPMTFISCLIAALAISGVPPLNGFASKWMVYQSLLEYAKQEDTAAGVAPWLLVSAVFGSALTLASFVKVIHSVFWGRMPEKLEGKGIREVGAIMWIPMIVIALLCVVLGVWVGLPVSKFFSPAVAELGVQMPKGMEVSGGGVEYAGGLWSATTATGLIIVGLVVGLVIFLIGKSLKIRTSHVFMAGEKLGTEDSRYAGTSFYENVRELPVIKEIYRDAGAGVFDVYHLGGRYGEGIVQFLRSLHTGVLPLYVSWCLIGLGLIMAYLIRLWH